MPLVGRGRCICASAPQVDIRLHAMDVVPSKEPRGTADGSAARLSKRGGAEPGPDGGMHRHVHGCGAVCGGHEAMCRGPIEAIAVVVGRQRVLAVAVRCTGVWLSPAGHARDRGRGWPMGEGPTHDVHRDEGVCRVLPAPGRLRLGVQQWSGVGPWSAPDGKCLEKGCPRGMYRKGGWVPPPPPRRPAYAQLMSP